MIQRRSPLQKLALALSATIGLASCARNTMNAAPAAPSEPEPAAAVTPAAAVAPAGGVMEPAPTDLEGQIAALGSAEARLNEVLGGGAEQQDEKVVTLPRKGGEKAGADAPKPKQKKEAERLSQGDACSTACSALASMERATLHLCGLAGESDRRCGEARSRVQSATTRVRASCPVCAER
jgi:hypothetical protein